MQASLPNSTIFFFLSRGILALFLLIGQHVLPLCYWPKICTPYYIGQKTLAPTTAQYTLFVPSHYSQLFLCKPAYKNLDRSILTHIPDFTGCSIRRDRFFCLLQLRGSKGRLKAFLLLHSLSMPNSDQVKKASNQLLHQSHSKTLPFRLQRVLIPTLTRYPRCPKLDFLQCVMGCNFTVRAELFCSESYNDYDPNAAIVSQTYDRNVVVFCNWPYFLHGFCVARILHNIATCLTLEVWHSSCITLATIYILQCMVKRYVDFT